MPYLVYSADTAEEKIYPLRQGKNTIGRSPNNTVVVVDMSLSRHHAEIVVTQNGFAIEDLKSLNHTFVNEIEVKESPLKKGDTIRCGKISFLFTDTITPKQEKVKEDDNNLLEEGTKVVKQYSPELTRISMGELISQDTENSVIKLREGEDDHQRALDKLKILLEVSKQLSLPQTTNQLLAKILDLLFDIINIDRAVILMENEYTRELEPKAIKTKTDEEPEFWSSKIINHVYSQGDAVVTADACRDQRFYDSQSVLLQSIHSSICIPLQPRDDIIGVLYLDNLSMSNVYADEDVEFLTALANQAAIAIDNAKLYEKIQSEAIIRNKLERFFPAAVTKKLKEETTIKIIETEVTALFADISGFTQMSSTMEPKQVISMLNEYFEVMVEQIVFRYEGTLEKYIGDALFAVWGAPYQQEDDTIKAIQAAIEMQWAVEKLNQKWQIEKKQPISIHIGINTGKVAAGNIGSEKLIQYATIGDTTNMTSRICNVAQAKEIVISEDTFNKISSLNMPTEKMELVTVKGKDKPLQLYRLLWQKIPV